VRTLAVNLAYLKKANEGKDEDLIFPHLSVKNGRRNIQLRRVLTKLGLRGTLHTFRHSAAAYYLGKGVPIKTVSSLLGHASETTTLRVYMEMTKEQEITAAVKSVYRDQENSGNNAELPSRQQELSEMLFKGDLDGLTNFGK
jgi:integrase